MCKVCLMFKNPLLFVVTLYLVEIPCRRISALSSHVGKSSAKLVQISQYLIKLQTQEITVDLDNPFCDPSSGPDRGPLN